MKFIRRFFAPSIRRRILAGFLIVALLVMVLTVATFYQLSQVQNLSAQIIPDSSQMGRMQELGLATTALDADLERFLVIRGAEYRDSVLQDLTDMTAALDESQRDAATDEVEPLQNAQEIVARLKSEIGTLLDGSVESDVNQRIVTIYADIEQVKQIQKDLAADELAQLQETAAAQGRITADVITQTVILGLVVFLIALTASVVINRTLRPIGTLTETATAIAGGDLNRTAPVQSQDEIGALAGAFNQMTGQLRDLVGSLEDRVQSRTEQLRASADVGRTVASVLDPDELLRRVVNLITERFGFYYAAVFTSDSQSQYAILREATGDAGRVLKAQKHQLEIGGQSMVGYVMANRRLRIALDVGEEAVRFANPLLPNTRSEIALPLVVGDQVLGALNVQSTEAAAFDETNAAVLQSMADQIAIALSNALSFTEAQAVARRSHALFAASREVGRVQADVADTIRAMMQAAADTLDYDRWCVLTFNELRTALVTVAARDWPDSPAALDIQIHANQPLVRSAVRNETVQINDRYDARWQELAAAHLTNLLSVPIMARGNLIGVVGVSRSNGTALTDGDVEVGRSLATLAAIAIENYRLLQSSQRTLRELDEANRQLTGSGWEKYARRRSRQGVIWASRSDRLEPDGEVGPSGEGRVGSQSLPEVTEALTLGHVATRLLGDGEQLSVAVPIKLRDVPIGTLRMIVPLRSWTTELSTSLESIASHVAQAAENARLIAASEERLARERALTEATENVRQHNEIDSILETAATELARYLNANHIAVRLTTLDEQAAGNGHTA